MAPESFFARYLPWLVAGAIVVLGLFVYGFRDVARFSWRRAWAISSVCFAESIRRRVWLIVLVGIAGMWIVSALQHPVDEQDAIRQTTKFCLFAAGLVVTITAIILACTNLPKEIDSRVIYTIVTKPTTRLEIVLGKILGFARVAAAILLVMGLFTFGYLTVRAALLRQWVATRLENNLVDNLSRPTLEHYKEAGLLASRVYEQADDLQIYSRLSAGSDEHWFFGGGEGMFMVPFGVPPQQLFPNPDANVPAPVSLKIFAGFEKSDYAKDPEQEKTQPAGPATLPWLIQNPDATAEQVRVEFGSRRGARGSVGQPEISVEILDLNMNTLVEPRLINGGRPMVLPDPSGKTALDVPIAPEGVAQLARSPLFRVQVIGNSAQHEYFAGKLPIVLDIAGQQMGPLGDPRAPADRRFIAPSFRTRSGRTGQQLRGGARQVPMAVYKFRDAPAHPVNGQIPFELRVDVERGGEASTEDQPTAVEVRVMQRKPAAQQSSPEPTPETSTAMSPTSTAPTSIPPTLISRAFTVYPETSRTTYFNLPAEIVGGNDFDVVLSCLTPGHYLSVQPRSLQMITANESFAFNLFKSMLILWLLAILVVSVAVFCSTFLSWPIAIVLTVMILLGHWGVDQLGDALAPGIGNMVATDFGFRSPETAKTVSTTVEALSKLLNAVAAVLPDISRFSALEDIERGVAVPLSRIKDSLAVLAMFGLPMLVLSYVFLRNKEVAP